MKKILVAIDGSEGGFRAVQYSAVQFSGSMDVSLTLLHVLPYLPPTIWDIGHLLNDEEKAAQATYTRKWLEAQKQKAEPMFQRAMTILQKEGFDSARIQSKMIYDSTDTADSILEEARTGNYLTLVLGRHGLSSLKHFFAGRTTTRILNHGAGLAICVVE